MNHQEREGLASRRVYRGGWVISGRRDCQAVRADVLTEGDRIVAVGTVDSAGAEVVDCQGMYLVPGLINLHAHLFGSGKPSKLLGGGKAQQLVLQLIRTSLGHRILDKMVREHLMSELYSGVTTVRSVGDFEESDLRIRNELLKGRLHGPRLFASGKAITVPTGHGDGTFANTGTTVEELTDLVNRQYAAGADFIKICVTGGVMDAKEKGHPGELKMTLEQTKAVCDRAHELGMPVASHTESPEGMSVAIRGGVDTVEHGASFTEEEQAILKKRGGGLVLTFSPAFPLARLSPDITKLNSICVYNSEVVLKEMKRGGETAKAAGIHVGLGTDASCTFAMQHGMWRELIYYQKIMNRTPTEALYTATLGNAELLGIQRETGSIEPGKAADMILVEGNPLEDLRRLRSPYAVVAQGYWHNPKLNKNEAIEKQLDELMEQL